MIKGSIVALVTPFNDNKIDEDVLRKLIDKHIEAGTSGILVAGCTGESFTLSARERNRLLNVAKEQSAGRVPIILGTGSSSMAKAIEMSRNAKDLGADYILVISPFGNKPSQHAMIHYYSAIAKVGPPVILYNVPGRTGKGILPETVCKLSKVDNIVGIKEASGDIDAVSYIYNNTSNFHIYSGDDSLTLPMLSIGAVGVISTVANLLPAKMTELVDSFHKGDMKTAMERHYELFPIIKALFLEGNPVPLKEAMNLMGTVVGDCRLPLLRMADDTREKLINTLFDGGFIK
ncbi:MAG: 4-hydroxy-tetrahydrodipicolinate synthase [Candidatus Zixiibacteriota bacterium]